MDESAQAVAQVIIGLWIVIGCLLVAMLILMLRVGKLERQLRELREDTENNRPVWFQRRQFRTR